MIDWLVREAGLVLSWWALVTLAGAAALPLCLRLLGALPDRGYTLARAAGVLLVAFVFWLLASLGFVNNSTGSMLLAWTIVLIVSLAIFARLGPSIDLRAWWRENRAVVIVGEVLFLVMLFAWAYYRAQQNNIVATEKPMELMFMNSVQRSTAFPPNDGWLSGYSISYYYFGYVMSAMLSMLSGISATVGFNLTISLLFALAGLSVFGVVYNLVRSRSIERNETKPRATAPSPPSRRPALAFGLLGVVMLLLMSNFHMPLIELPYFSHTASASYLHFWDAYQRDVPEATDGAGSLDPATWGNWWWWPASRTVQDKTLTNDHIEIIDEFPAFSFLLSDTHPHVLALPFVLLALGMALNLLLSGRPPRAAEIAFYAICIGGLAFLNTWDGPVYLLAIVGAEALRRLARNGGKLHSIDWLRIAWLGIVILIAGLVLYLPFWLGFRSQASGLLPNVINPTSTPQFFLMFGPFIFIIGPFLLLEARRAGKRLNWSLGLQVFVAVLLVLVVALLAIVAAASYIPDLRATALNFVDQAGGWSAVIPIIISRRVSTILTTVGLIVAIMLVVMRLFPRTKADNGDEPVITYPPSTGFVLLLIGMGLALILMPEFFYLRDNFGNRINSIFKFYYQAWLLFSIGGAYAVYTFIDDHRLALPPLPVRALYSVATVVIVTVGLLYLIYGVYSRSQLETGFAYAQTPPTYTLDGAQSVIGGGNDYQAIMCLKDLLQGQPAVVAEAQSVSSAYNANFGRVATLTGIPIIMGWGNHEGQWRGSTYSLVVGSRPQDLTTLYTTHDASDVQHVVTTYGIQYIFVGQTERQTYQKLNEQIFSDSFNVVCERGDSRFYVVNSRALVSSAR